MKHRIIITLLMSVVVAAGCSKSSDTPDPSMPDSYEPSTSAISFQTEINWGDEETQTRGFATEAKNFTSFGVLAYYGDKDDDISTLTPNFMYDQEVTKGSDDVWSYSPIKYWSNNTNDLIQFFAYHPYGSAEIELSKNDATGYPTFTITPADKPYDQDDFIFDYTYKLSKSDTGVELSFKHKLAQARVYAARLGTEDDGETIQILGMTVSGHTASGVLKYDDEIRDFVWDLSADRDTKATYSFNSQELSSSVTLLPLAEATNDASKYTALGYGQGQSYMMLIPDDKVGELNFSVLFSYYDGVSKAQAYQEFVLKEGSTLVEGEIKIYLLLIDPSDVGFGTINVTSQPWVEETISDDGDDDKWEIE